MTIYFHNPGVIDLNVIRLMGVSVKETESPIGYFGTGLKFALATLLRTGHTVEIKAGDEILPIITKAEAVRGEEFHCVYIGTERLPFTTKLGRNWEPWQAFRELHSNALDEGGGSSDRPTDDDTVIIVDGDGIEDAFSKRHEIFLSTKPIESFCGVEVHRGGGRYVFYRGVRAGALPECGHFTYNITKKMDLSEDRNFKSLWDVEWAIETTLPAMPSKQVASEILLATDKWDGALTFSYCGAPSKEFIEVAASRRNDSTLPPSAQAILATHSQSVESYPECEIGPAFEMIIGDALALLRRLDCDLERSEIVATETLGPGVYGLYHIARDDIFLAKQALDNGVNFVAATLYEEWLHKRHKLKDKTRELQQFLFDRLVSVAQQIPANVEWESAA